MTAQLNNSYTCLGKNTSRILIVFSSEREQRSGCKRELKYQCVGKLILFDTKLIQKTYNEIMVTNQDNSIFLTEGSRRVYSTANEALALLRRKAPIELLYQTHFKTGRKFKIVFKLKS